MKKLGAMVKENPAAPIITDVQYFSGGMTMSNVSFSFGFTVHL